MKRIALLLGILFISGCFFLMFFGCATQEEAVKEEEVEAPKEEVKAPKEEVKAPEEEVKEEEVVKEEPPKEEEEVEVVKVVDSDDDGVYDDKDKCPDTPYGVEVDSSGCPFDSDGDGVYDYLDMCPDTAYGAVVDPFGCSVLEAPQKLVEGQYKVALEFDIDSASVKPVYYYRFKEEIEGLLRANPEAELVEVVIKGHSDSSGSKRYNHLLSERRAKSIKRFLIGQFGVTPDIIKIQAFGETKPIASNSTSEGRQRNRRVEVTLTVKNLRE